MIITGTLVNRETRQGSMEDRQNPNGPRVNWDFELLTIRSESGQLVEVKVRREDAHGIEGFRLYEPVRLEVDLPAKTRVNFNLHATTQAQKPAPVKSAG